MVYLGITLGWILFGGIHSLLARQPVKNQLTLRLGPLGRYYRLGYNGLAIATFFGLLQLHRQGPVDYVWPPHLVGRLLGGGYMAGGLIICLLALGQYDWAHFVGWPVTKTRPSTAILKQTGILGYVRHPLYLGTILMLSGHYIQIPTWSNAIMLIMGALYIRIGISFEEGRLMEEYGETYRHYRQRVPMLLPHRKRRMET